MKKLMIAAFAVCAAVAVQAATYQWRPGTLTIYDGAGSSAAATTMTVAYLFNTTDYSQQTLLDALKGGATWATVINNAIGSTTLASGKNSTYVNTTDKNNAGSIKTTGAGTADEKNYIPAYFAVYNAAAQKVLLIDSKDTLIPGDPEETTKITFSGYATPSKSSFDAATSMAADAFKDNGSGWYTIGSSPEPTPEPTSGLLLLLGVAGLALRRRRA